MRRARLASLALACLVAAGAAEAQTPRVLVMPFENVARDSRIVWLSEASAVLLADELSARGLEAIARDERVAAFTRLKVPPAVGLTDATIIRIGRLVGASDVVVGSVSLVDGVLHVQARSLSLDTGRQRERIDEHAPLTDLFALVDRLGMKIGGPMGASPATPPRFRPPVAAFELYVKGLLAATPATAIGYLDAALEEAPSFAAPRLAQWDIYTEQGEHQRALATAGAVSTATQEYPRARFLASLSHLALNQHAEAFTILEALAHSQPTASVYNNLGVVQLRRGGSPRTGTATYYFTHAVNADDHDPDFCFNLGYAYWREKNADAAIYWLQQAVRRNPADDGAHLVLSAAFDLGGYANEARRELDLARRLSSEFADAKGRAADLIPSGMERVKTRLAPTAWTRVDAALVEASQRDDRELANFYLERGRRLFAEERDEEALDQLRRALFLSPYLAEAHVLSGRIHLRASRPAEAIGALQIALWSEESAGTYAALAAAYLDAEDATQARAMAERALALSPGLPEARDVLDRLGRH